MAKQIGPNFKEMCKQNLQFYKMDGKYYVRKKSSLSRRRVLTDKAFTLTMVHANIMAQASPIASAVYRQIPKPDKDFNYFRALVGMAQTMVKLGMNKEEIYEVLYNLTFPPVQSVVAVVKNKTISNPSFADEVLNTIFSVPDTRVPVQELVVLGVMPP
jgi:hypothetical protein